MDKYSKFKVFFRKNFDLYEIINKSNKRTNKIKKRKKSLLKIKKMALDYKDINKYIPFNENNQFNGILNLEPIPLKDSVNNGPENILFSNNEGSFYNNDYDIDDSSDILEQVIIPNSSTIFGIPDGIENHDLEIKKNNPNYVIGDF